MMKRAILAPCLLVMLMSSCGGSHDSGGNDATSDPTDIPIPGLTDEQLEQHERGDELFSKIFPESEGLGPVYIQASCESCHVQDRKGPGTVTRMVVVKSDGVTRADDQSALPFGDVARPAFTSQLHHGVTVPVGNPNIKISLRIGPAIFGRGWMAAVDASEIERQAKLQEGQPENGRVARLSDGRLGRFGVKARIATIKEFTDAAFNGDMGLTSPAARLEPPNPEGVMDDLVRGPDLSEATVDDVSFYVRTLDIPPRQGQTAQGMKLFAEARCAVCHVPKMRTSANFPFTSLADKDAEIYSDMLLHDMGTTLADGIVEGGAREREWRTAPLIGLKSLTSFLHDGRAHSVEDAILMHGGPGTGSAANASIEAYKALSVSEKQQLQSFVLSL